MWNYVLVQAATAGTGSNKLIFFIKERTTMATANDGSMCLRSYKHQKKKDKRAKMSVCNVNRRKRQRLAFFRTHPNAHDHRRSFGKCASIALSSTVTSTTLVSSLAAEKENVNSPIYAF